VLQVGFNSDDICEIESERTNQCLDDGLTDERTDAYVAFRVYYFVGGWSREVRSAVLVADSISRVHAPLNAVVLRKEVVDFSLSLSLSPSFSLFSFLSLFLSSSLSLSLSLLPSSSISLSLVLPTLFLPLLIRVFGPYGPRFSFLRRKESEKKDSEVKEDRILLRRPRYYRQYNIAYVRVMWAGHLGPASVSSYRIQKETLSSSLFFSVKLARMNSDKRCDI